MKLWKTNPKPVLFPSAAAFFCWSSLKVLPRVGNTDTFEDRQRRNILLYMYFAAVSTSCPTARGGANTSVIVSNGTLSPVEGVANVV